jgi:predicted O-methyltransferase YrrM
MTSRETTPYLPLPSARADAGPLVDRLFTLAFAAVQWPWLLRSLSGGRRSDRAALLERLGLSGDSLPYLGSWKADAHFLRLATEQVLAKKPRQVVELGAGASTLVLSRALGLAGGGQLQSHDQHADFVDATRVWLADHGLPVDLRVAGLAPAPGPWRGQWYALDGVPDRIDLLVIDGPPWTNHPFIRGAAETLFPRIPVGGVVLLDDAARPGERVVARRWRARWPGFCFTYDGRGTKGALIGERFR